ncbi:MAG: hypothetical protein EAZ91_06420 [Cytophagales bacterium]|nr:MAG: hypothetical protein EAZ91_06420 [Cytophagales bacterium]
MKKSLLWLALVLTVGASYAQAQTYRKFKVDMTSGYSRPTSGVGDVSGGLNLSIEPKYNVTDQIAVGLKFEATVLASADRIGSDGLLLAVVRSSSLTGEYYFGSKTVRPYLGVGVGLYRPAIIDTSEGFESIDIGAERQFGFAPRLGLQMGHFRLGVEYNMVKDSNFFSIKTGTTIGGGRK